MINTLLLIISCIFRMLYLSVPVILTIHVVQVVYFKYTNKSLYHDLERKILGR